jgi:hypothetical protein
MQFNTKGQTRTEKNNFAKKLSRCFQHVPDNRPLPVARLKISWPLYSGIDLAGFGNAWIE